MDYTIYTKIKEKNGKTRDIMAVDLPFYCRCPECNKEHSVPLFEMIADDPDFDLYSTRIYCESCSSSFSKNREDKIREDIKHTLNDVDNMPIEKLYALSNLLYKFEEECTEW